MLDNILEISNSRTKSGRRKIEIVLHTIPTDEQETNRNGIHWSKEYVLNNIDSIKGIPICAEFLSDDRDIPLGHGYTSTEKIDGKATPLFENSDVVGTMESATIKEIQVNNNTITALVGTGYLYEQRYPKLIKWIKENLALSKVDTSIEICGLEENDNKIIYDGNATDEYRIPKIYDYTGVAILSVMPADENAIVLECATAKENIKEEKIEMDEKELKQIIVDTITETNSIKAESDEKITELTSQIIEKDEKINELESKISEMETASSDAQAKVADLEKTISELNEKIDKFNIEKKMSELDGVLSKYTDDEVKYAEAEINSYKEDPLNGNVETIKSKICVSIVENQREIDRLSEQNSANENDVVDIFSEINSETSADDLEDCNIF